jgi:hypothetical protein
MRTTLTLDDDVAIGLERLQRTRRQSFRSLVNDLLRRGIASEEHPPATGRPRFETAVADTGRALLPNVDDIAGVLDLLGEEQAP